MGLLEILLDPDRRAKAADEQAKLKQSIGTRLARSIPHANYVFGVARETLALERLQAGENDAAYDQLGEGLALQARFTEATEAVRDIQRRELYAAKAAAIERIGELSCTHTGEHLPSQRVWNGKQMIAFTRCVQCGALAASEAFGPSQKPQSAGEDG